MKCSSSSTLYSLFLIQIFISRVRLFSPFDDDIWCSLVVVLFERILVIVECHRLTCERNELLRLLLMMILTLCTIFNVDDISKTTKMKKRSRLSRLHSSNRCLSPCRLKFIRMMWEILFLSLSRIQIINYEFVFLPRNLMNAILISPPSTHILQHFNSNQKEQIQLIL